MEDVLNELTNNVEMAISEIGRLKNEIDETGPRKANEGEQVGVLENRIRELERKSNDVKSSYAGNLSSFSQKINNIIKKLDNVV